MIDILAHLFFNLRGNPDISSKLPRLITNQFLFVCCLYQIYHCKISLRELVYPIFGTLFFKKNESRYHIETH